MAIKRKMALTVQALAAVAMLGITAPVISAEAVIQAASCFPIGSPPGKPFENAVDMINKSGVGEVKVVMKGGAPAIGSPFTLTQKAGKGVYDMVGCPEAYFGNILPEAPALRLTDISYAEMRKNGGMAIIEKKLAGKGLHYVGRHHNFGEFYLFTNNKLEKPDLTGMHLRVSPVYAEFFKALGGTTQSSNYAQVYTYMENGTVQGYGWPALGWNPAWLKVTKYRVDPGFYQASLHTLVNLKKWKSLTPKQRGIITAAILQLEKVTEPGSVELQTALKAQTEKTTAGGMSVITFKGADAEKWMATAKKTGWDEVLEKSPKDGKKLMELFTK
ncbi:MAG: TRAP transporter substrate-binding protein DctP [Burkholderiaceae bacterium]